jgi:glycerol-3-phosphate dehydrogenase
VEGINTLKAIKKVIKNNKIDFPLLYSLNEIVYKNKDPKIILLDLLRSNKI